MEKPLLNNKLYSLYRFENEAEFERVIVKNVADISDLDTIVVPALEEGFKRVFLGEHRWWAIRVSESMIPKSNSSPPTKLHLSWR